MKVTESWLREWIDPPLDFAALGQRLTFAGLELEGMESVAFDFTQVIVAEITAVASHPNADKLNVCTVFDGEQSLQIVCGASNVRAGLKVALAQMGAVLAIPDAKPLKIKKGKLRGVESFGMLCSASELGLASQSSGILELPDDAITGTCLRDYLQLNDQVMELSITPNRGDALSMAGLARELTALTQAPIKTPHLINADVTISEKLEVHSNVPEACPRFCGRVIRGVNLQTATPLWMKERLRRSGLRSISFAVDVVNYVMLEWGQPMHAYDLSKLSGNIQVRYANPGESLTLLNEQVIELSEDCLLVADDEKALSLAGVMGGLHSAVGQETRDLFIESAHFVPNFIFGKARSFGLQSDAAYRYERGVSPELTMLALERVTQLMIEYAGGEAGPVQEYCQPETVTVKSLTLRAQSIQRILGIAIESSEVMRILSALGCQVEEQAEAWNVQLPSSRFDLTQETDLIEELARIVGYDAIPSEMPSIQPRVAQKNLEKRTTRSLLSRYLVNRCYQEVINYSFVSTELESIFGRNWEKVNLINPMSSALDVMRSSLWPGLMSSLQYNLNRQQTQLRLFEMGTVFAADTENSGFKETTCIAGLMFGNALPEQWGESERALDFFDLKGDVEGLMDQLGIRHMSFVPLKDCVCLHPGQAAEIHLDGQSVGYLGTLHPQVQQSLGLAQPVYLFEIALTDLQQRRVPVSCPISKFPAIRRDLALKVPQNMTWDALKARVLDQSSDLLQDVHVFDVYHGEGIEVHEKSMALSLILQSNSRTLEDQEVDEWMEQLLSRMTALDGVSLR